jgi:hypothetical protein
MINISYNCIESLDGLACLYSLQSFDASFNQIDDFKELEHISKLPCLEAIVLEGNPIQEFMNYRQQVYSELLKSGSNSSKLLITLDGCELSEKERHTLRGMMFMAPEDMRRELSFNPFNSPISTINHSNNEPTTSTPSEIGPKDDVDVLLKYNNPLDREALDEFSFTTNVVVTTSLYHDSFTSYCHTIRERNRLNRYKNEKKLIMFQTKSEEVEVNTITIDLDDVVVNWSEMLDYLLQSTPEYVIPRTDSPVNIQSSYIGSLSFDVQLEPSASSLAPSQVNDGIIQPVYTKWSAEGVEENQIPKTHSI